jgi:hypothetical protein
VTPLDWVLKPNTTYYQANNKVAIGTTTSVALFGQNITNDIHDSFGVSGGNNSNTSTVWTGFGDGLSFTTGPLTCNAWTYAGAMVPMRLMGSPMEPMAPSGIQTAVKSVRFRAISTVPSSSYLPPLLQIGGRPPRTP